MKIKFLHKCIEINISTDFSQLPIGTEITFKDEIRIIRAQLCDTHGTRLIGGTCLSKDGRSGHTEKAKLTVKQMIKVLLRR